MRGYKDFGCKFGAGKGILFELMISKRRKISVFALGWLTLGLLPVIYVVLGLYDFLRYGPEDIHGGVVEMMALSSAWVLALGFCFLIAPIRKQLSSNVARKLYFMLLPVSLLLVAIEGGSGLYLRYRFPPSETFGRDRLRSEAYAGFNWAEEIIELGGDVEYEYAPFRLWKARPMKSALLNIDAKGQRATWQPPSPDPQAPVFRVQIYGGSTVFCLEVPDEHTLPSYLARELARRMPDRRVIVENCGVPAYIRAQEAVYFREKLRSGPKPDLVIFYDGANDVLFPAWEGIPHKRYEYFREAMSGREIGIPAMAGEFFFYASNLGRLAEKLAKIPREPDTPLSSEEVQRRAARAVEPYLALADDLRRNCRAEGIECVFFLQPTLYLKEKPAGLERVFMNYERRFRTGIVETAATFAELVARREAEAGNDDYHDLSRFFFQRQDEVFLDMLHLGPGGNADVAEAMAEALTANGALP